MAKVIEILPDLSGDELLFVQGLIKDLDDDQARMFATAYRTRRRDPLLVLLTACLGLVGFAGIQRFIIGQIGMGLLYFFTGGLCLIGTIIDMINYQRLAFEYNSREAQQVALMIQGGNSAG